MKEVKKSPVKKTKTEINDGIIEESVAAANTSVEEVTTEVVDTKPLAKKGKRSAKALVEAEEKQAKEDNKAAVAKKVSKLKVAIKPARTRLERAGKKYREVAKLIDKDKEYSLKESVELAIQTSTTKFDSTVELHVKLNVDPKQADQNLRDNLILPSGTGKSVLVAVFADADDAKSALAAGADIAAGDEFLQQLEKNIIDFDLLITMPTMMPKLAKYAKTLGPKGLMPNPKSGTVTNNVVKAVEQAKAGRLEYRVDSTGIIHSGIGKVSFGAVKIQANVEAVLSSIKNNKPASVKTALINSVYLTTSMGPSVRVALGEL